MLRIFKYILLVLMFTVIIYTRFVNLNWDRGWGFHPDENNLWGASRQIKLFSKMDPKFYDYGGFSIYLYSFVENKVQARTISALLQTVIIFMLFYAGKRLSGWSGGFISAMFAVFSAGLVQAAHFLTVETLIGFFGLSIALLFILRVPPKVIVIVLPILLGLGIGTKISFLPLSLSYLLLVWEFRKAKAPLIKIVSAFVSGVLLTTVIFIVINPMIVIKGKEVLSGLSFASQVASGTIPVFWTRPFTGTTPFLYQIIHVFPYVTGWFFLPLVLVGCFTSIKKNKRLVFMTLVAFLLFAPFFSKWTRYVVQVLPILILTAAIGADWIWEKGKIGKVSVILAIISFMPQFFSVMKVYGSPDNRLTAADWAAVNIPKTAKIFTEGMDLGIIPFNPIHGETITLFNFYELDEDKTGQKKVQLEALVNESDYFVSVSNRVYGNSLRLQNRFSASAEFYRQLFDGSLGYKKIYESPSVVIPAEAGIYLNRFRVKPGMTVGFSPEETSQVFDHPTVMIFKKTLKH